MRDRTSEAALRRSLDTRVASGNNTTLLRAEAEDAYSNFCVPIEKHGDLFCTGSVSHGPGCRRLVMRHGLGNLGRVFIIAVRDTAEGFNDVVLRSVLLRQRH